MRKNQSKNYSALCYIGLLFLIIFLLLPPMLRLFGKNLYAKKAEKKDVIIVLQCNNSNETISSTFLNDIPQNISYKIKGNYVVDNNTSNIDTNDNSVQSNDELGELTKEEQLADEKEENQLISLIKDYSKIEYDVNTNITTFKVDVKDLQGLSEYTNLFSTLNNQQAYFTSKQMYCEKANY